MRYRLSRELAHMAHALWAMLFPRYLRTTVGNVYDGDTFYREGIDEPVRLISMDAPERDQGPYGHEAAEALRAMLPRGTEVTLQLEPRTHDKYGRLRAYVHLRDGRIANLEMVRQGFAVANLYRGAHPILAWRIRTAEWKARIHRRGLWNAGGFRVRPATHRRLRSTWLGRMILRLLTA